MGGGDGQTAAPAGESDHVARRRRALHQAGTTMLLVGPDGRVEMAAGAPGMVGASVTDIVVASPAEVKRAIAQAQAGRETVIPTRRGQAVRCLPLRTEPEKGDFVLVVLAAGEGADEALRVRARDLEAIAEATSALARSADPDETRRIACGAALELAGADVAAFLAVDPDERGMTVLAASDPELEGRGAPLERSVLAARALGAGEICLTSDLRDDEAGWPFASAGMIAAAWQPVRRSGALRDLIAVGWAEGTAPDPERVRESLDAVSEEVAVALDRAIALEQLSDMARTDPLTELSNRRAWQEELAREMAKAERGALRLSIGLIDLDELKGYNDRWGHAAGDRVLLTAAARWRRRLRLTDLLARIGGDEFAVAMPNCGLREAVAVGDELRHALPDGLSCSVGVAEWKVGESAEELLARADEALYAAKNSGRDATFSVPGPVQARPRRSVPSS